MLSPAEPPPAMKDQISTQLPKGIAIIDVFADFMRFLFDSTKEFFVDIEPNGRRRWDSVSKDITLVLTHPNGWGGPQRTQLRAAAVQAGIFPNTPIGHSSIYFVTEGGATFNFCATHTKAGGNVTLKVRPLVPAQCRFSNTLAAWRASFDHRCGFQNDRYQYLQSSQ